MTTLSLQERYASLRKQLTSLNYPELFGIDAVELVEHLVQDLLTATSSYKTVQEKESRLNADLALVQAQLFPLRRENARLTRENHELHIDAIRQTEEASREMEQFSQQLRDLTDKANELRALNHVYEEQLAAKDDVIQRLREAYEGVVDPALKAKHSTTSSIRSSSKISRVSRVDSSRSENIDKSISAISGKASAFSTKTSKTTKSLATLQRAAVAAYNPLLETATAKTIDALRAQLDTANGKLRESEQEIARLKSSLVAREQELSRSNRLVGNAAARTQLGEQNASAPSLSPINPQTVDASNKRIIDQLNSQVDFLNEQLAFREAQLATLHAQLQESEDVQTEFAVTRTTLERVKEENKRLLNRVHQLEQRMLSSALNTPSRTPSRDFRRDIPSSEVKETSLSPFRSSANELASTAAAQQEELVKTMRDEKQSLEREIQALQAKVQELSVSVTASSPNTNNNNNSTKRNATSLSPDAALLADLNAEVESLRRRNGALEKQTRDLEARLSLRQSQAQSLSLSPSQKIKTAQGVSIEPKVLLTQLKEQDKSLQEAQFERNKLQAMLSEAQRELEGEKEKGERLQRECERLRETLTETHNENEHLQQELSLQAANHDALQVALREREKERVGRETETVRLRETVQSLQSERARLEEQLQWQEHSRRRGAAISQSVQEEDRQRDEERERENEQLRRELNTLHSELSLTQQRLATLQREAEERTQRNELSGSLTATQRARFDELSREKRQLVEEVALLLSQKEKVTTQCHLLQHSLEEERAQKKSLEQQLRMQQQEQEELLFKHNHVKDLVTRLEANYEIAQNRVMSFEEIIKKMSVDKSGFLDESLRLNGLLQVKDHQIASLKAVIAELDAERDRHTENIEDLEEKIAQRERETAALREQTQSLRGMAASAEKTLQSKEREMQQMHKAMLELDARANALKVERGELLGKFQEKTRREGSMSEDLLVMTKENQTLSLELSQLCAERDQLSLQVRELVQQLQFSESNKHGIEVEKQDLLDNYRVVIKERRKTEDDLKALSSIHSGKLSLLKQFEKENMEMQSKLQAYANLEERWSIEKSALNNHIELLNDSLQDLQRKIENLEAEQRKSLQDTHAMKQTNSMLNERLAIVMKRAAASSEANKVLTTRLGSVERERDAMRAIVEVERQRAGDMLKVAEVARIDAATKELQLQRLKSELSDRLDESAGSSGTGEGSAPRTSPPSVVRTPSRVDRSPS